MFNVVTKLIDNIPFTVVSPNRCSDASKVIVITRKDLAVRAVAAIMSIIRACEYYVYYRPVNSDVLSVMKQISNVVVAGVHCSVVIDLLKHGFKVYVFRVSEDGDMVELRLVERVDSKVVWSRLQPEKSF